MLSEFVCLYANTSFSSHSRSLRCEDSDDLNGLLVKIRGLVIAVLLITDQTLIL